jgi:autotransporter translocation and assembly factor TamB
VWRVARRIARLLAWIGLSIVLVVLIAMTTLILWARSESGRRILLSTVVSKAQERLNGQVRIGGLEGDLTHEIVLRDLRLYDAERKLAVSAETIRVEPDLRALWSRTLRARSLGVTGARVHARFLRDGQLNLTALQQRPAKPSPRPDTTSARARDWDIEVEALHVDGQAIVDTKLDHPMRGFFQASGGLQWQQSAPTFHHLRARFVADSTPPVDATLRLDGQRDHLEGALVVLVAGGELRAQAHGSMPLGGTLSWRGTVQSRELDPAAVLPGAPHGSLEVAAHGHGDGQTASVAMDKLTLDAADTHLSLRGAVEIGAVLTADVRADLRSTDLSRWRGLGLPALRGSVDAHADVRRTRAHTEGQARIRARDLETSVARLRSLTLTATGDEKHLALALDAAEPDGATAQVRAHGVPLRGEWPFGIDVQIDTLGFGAHGDGWRLTTPGRLRIDRHAVVVAVALAAAPHETLTLDGSIARDSGRLAVDLHAHRLGLELLRPLLPQSYRSLAGRADASAQISGTLHDPSLVAHLAVPDCTLGNLSSSRLLVDVTYRRPQLQARWDVRFGDGGAAGTLEGTLALSVDASRRRLMRKAPLLATIRGRSVDLSQLPIELLGVPNEVHGGRVDVTLDGKGTLDDAQAQLHAKVHALRISSLDGIELTLDGEYKGRTASATVSAIVRGQPVLTARAQSHVEVYRLMDAQRRRNVPVAADVDIPSVDLSRLGPLGGTLAGAAQIRGTLARPTAKAELHGRDLQLSDLRLTRLDARAEWDGDALTAKLDAAQGPRGSLHFEASAPASASAPMQARLEAHSFTFALEGIASVRRLEGTLEANLGVSGARAHPALTGFLRIDQGAFAAGTDPRLFRDLTVDIAAHDHAVELRRLALKVNRGALTAHGRLTLEGHEPKSFHLQAQADRFPFDPTNAGAWANAQLELDGKKMGNRIEGTLSVAQGQAHLPALAKPKVLEPTGPLEDVVFVDVPVPDAASASEHPQAPLAVQVLAYIPGPFKVDSPEMHAELRGELEIRTVDGQLGVFGHVETTSGQFELLGREYEIERVRVSFHGDLDPEVDVRLTRVLSDTTVIVSVHGTYTAPRLELTSDPPIYNTSQVLGTIVSGNPDNQRLDTTAIDQQLTSAISGALVSKIKGQLVPGLPVDVITVDTTASEQTFGALRGARLEVGTYVRHNIYVSYVQHFGATVTDLHRTNSYEANIEYQLKRHFVIGVRYGDAGIGGVDFAWTLRY